jgi:hypothetical protein
VLPIIDPSIHATLDGELTGRRGADQGTADNKQAVIELVNGGHLELHGFDQTRAYYGRWTPTGELVYSFNNRLVTSGALGGSFAIQQHSTDHWIWEASFSAEPTYTVTYSCKVIP